MGSGKMLHDISECEEDVFNVYPKICFIFEVFHVYSSHIPQGLYDQHLQLYLLAMMMYILINSYPFTIFKPFLKLRQISILRILGWNYYANVLIVLIITKFLSDIVEAEDLMEEVHYCVYILI